MQLASARRWSELAPGVPLTEEAIRARHQPGGHYRIAASTYPAGTDFAGVSQPATFYIVSGRCKFTCEGVEVSLIQGDVLIWPGGDFSVSVTGGDNLQFVRAWLLPLEFRK